GDVLEEELLLAHPAVPSRLPGCGCERQRTVVVSGPWSTAARAAAGAGAVPTPIASSPVPVDLGEMLDPAHTAVVTMELQNGVVGDASPMRDLVDAAAARNVIPNAAKVVRAARAAGARVVHCTAEFRPDLAGSAFNSPLLAAISKAGPHLLIGSR